MIQIAGGILIALLVLFVLLPLLLKVVGGVLTELSDDLERLATRRRR